MLRSARLFTQTLKGAQKCRTGLRDCGPRDYKATRAEVNLGVRFVVTGAKSEIRRPKSERNPKSEPESPHAKTLRRKERLNKIGFLHEGKGSRGEVGMKAAQKK